MKKTLLVTFVLFLTLVSEKSQGQVVGEFTTYTFWTSYNSLVIHPDGRFELTVYNRPNLRFIDIREGKRVTGTHKQDGSSLFLFDKSNQKIGQLDILYHSGGPKLMVKELLVENGDSFLAKPHEYFLCTKFLSKDGIPIESGSYDGEFRDGIWIIYDATGKPVKNVLYYKGQKVADPFVYKMPIK